jgi:cell division transport system ATP-binding protein
MIRFEAVGLRYPGGEPQRGMLGPPALSDISFALPRGSFTWLLGPSGAGKSSVLRLMHLALRPSRGEVEVLGLRTSRAPRAAMPAVRRRIGVVFQDFRLLPYLSVFDNVALPLRLAGRPEASLRADVTEMLEWLGLGAAADRPAGTLDTSGRQALAVARALAPRPELILMDEPLLDLAPGLAERVLTLLAALGAGQAAVVLAGRDPARARKAGAGSIRLQVPPLQPGSLLSCLWTLLFGIGS